MIKLRTWRSASFLTMKHVPANQKMNDSSNFVIFFNVNNFGSGYLEQLCLWHKLFMNCKCKYFFSSSLGLEFHPNKADKYFRYPFNIMSLTCCICHHIGACKPSSERFLHQPWTTFWALPLDRILSFVNSFIIKCKESFEQQQLSSFQALK